MVGGRLEHGREVDQPKYAQQMGERCGYSIERYQVVVSNLARTNIRDALGWLCCVWMLEVGLLGLGGQSGSKTKLTMPIHHKTPRKLRVQAHRAHFF
jgi:hypothetical protein